MANTAATSGQFVDLGGETPAVASIAVGYNQPSQVGIGVGQGWLSQSAGLGTTLSGLSSGTALIMSGSGTPGTLTAPPGSLYLRTDQVAASSGTTLSRLFVNFSGTAWTALTSQS